MENRATAPARVLATFALVAAFLILVVVVSTSLDGDSGSGGEAPAPQATTKRTPPREAPASYVVQNGDTLTSIAARMGVSVARIQELNPGIDPQILVSGEKLKLR